MAKIDVVSLGIGDPQQLATAARECIAGADIIIGAPHHFDKIAGFDTVAEQIAYPSPIAKLDSLLQHYQKPQYQHHKVTVLASGDALFYGIGSILVETIQRANLRFHPNISSIQAAMHQLGLPWQNAQIVSLHGRPTSTIRRYLTPNVLLGIFTDAVSHPVAIAAELLLHGYATSQIWVCQALGSRHQRLSLFDAAELAGCNQTFAPLNVCIIQLGKSVGGLPTFPGIPDHRFSTGAKPGFGMISKREVRLAILSMMQPTPAEVAWDIGAGCGSVSVEWARWNPRGTIYAIESKPARRLHIDINRNRFGVATNCHSIAATAPDCCAALAPPDCIFIGGSNGKLEQLITYCWAQLGGGGKLVVAAVTASSQRILRQFYQQQYARGVAVEYSRISVSKSIPDSITPVRLLPVQLLKCIKQ